MNFVYGIGSGSIISPWWDSERVGGFDIMDMVDGTRS